MPLRGAKRTPENCCKALAVTDTAIVCGSPFSLPASGATDPAGPQQESERRPVRLLPLTGNGEGDQLNLRRHRPPLALLETPRVGCRRAAGATVARGRLAATCPPLSRNA